MTTNRVLGAFSTVLLSFSLVVAFNARVVKAEEGWTMTYGGTSTDETCAMIQTSDGGYALAGNTWSFGAGDADFWLVKTDSAGNAQWNRTYGGPDGDFADRSNTQKEVKSCDIE